MKKNPPVFMDVGKHSLYLGLVLAEARYPLLFTCLDEGDDMYAAACFLRAPNRNVKGFDKQ